MSRPIAFFDFDGTITTRDSMFAFIYYSVGPLRYWGGFFCLSPVLMLYVVGLLSNSRAKEVVLSWFFAGLAEAEFRRLGEVFSREVLDSIIRPEARARIQWHQQEKHEVAVVTASADLWVTEWCRRNGLALIATRLEFIDGRFSGKLAGENCHGPEKESRIRQTYALADFDRIYAYGDTSGDREMIALAQEKYYCWKKID